MPAQPNQSGAEVARSKSTSRAEARRRHRAAQAAARAAATEELDPDQEASAGPDAEPAPRTSLIRIPNVLEDLRALPGMFRSKPLLWAPILLMVVAFGVALLPLPSDPTLRGLVQFVLSSFLVPTAILPMFLAGVIAPRASYLVGLLVGLLNGVLVIAMFTLNPTYRAAVPPSELPSAALWSILIAALYGLAIGAFASWYRDFLRRSGERRRTALEARAREKKREQKRVARPAR
jgi:hypothetical protein